MRSIICVALLFALQPAVPAAAQRSGETFDSSSDKAQRPKLPVWPTPPRSDNALCATEAGRRTLSTRLSKHLSRFDAWLSQFYEYPEKLMAWKIDRLRDAGLPEERLRELTAQNTGYFAYNDQVPPPDQMTDAPRVIAGAIDEPACAYIYEAYRMVSVYWSEPKLAFPERLSQTKIAIAIDAEAKRLGVSFD